MIIFKCYDMRYEIDQNLGIPLDYIDLTTSTAVNILSILLFRVIYRLYAYHNEEYYIINMVKKL